MRVQAQLPQWVNCPDLIQWKASTHTGMAADMTIKLFGGSHTATFHIIFVP
jgi:hypothetical protein